MRFFVFECKKKPRYDSHLLFSGKNTCTSWSRSQGNDQLLFIIFEILPRKYFAVLNIVRNMKPNFLQTKSTIRKRCVQSSTIKMIERIHEIFFSAIQASSINAFICEFIVFHNHILFGLYTSHTVTGVVQQENDKLEWQWPVIPHT